MIEVIAIEGFQSLAKVQLRFGRFTCIVGDSDSGKSAFVRAIQALIEARRGADFITVGKDSANVLIGFTGGTAVAWRKTKTTGKYILVQPGRPKQEFTKYGASCPTEVDVVLQFGKVVVDDQVAFNPNIIGQFDSLFLITERGSAAVKILSTVTNANNLMLSVREANVRASRAASEVRVYEEESDVLKHRLATYEGLEDEQKKLDQLKERIGACVIIQSVVDDLLVKRQRIFSVAAVINHLRVEIVTAVNVLELCDRALECEKKADELKVLTLLYNRAIKAVTAVDDICIQVMTARMKVELLEKVEPLDSKLQMLLEMKTMVISVEGKTSKINIAKDCVATLESKLLKIEAELNLFEYCPLCGRTFDRCEEKVIKNEGND